MTPTPSLIAKEIEDAADSLETRAQTTYLEYLANTASAIKVNNDRHPSCIIVLNDITINSETRSVSSETQSVQLSHHAELALVHYFVTFLSNTVRKMDLNR